MSLPTEKHWIFINDLIASVDKKNRIGISISDLFALGCYLSIKGERIAGTKAVNTALLAIDLDNKNRTLFLNIIDNLEGNEFIFFKNISAHSEINDLFIQTS